ncbi:hypothetical protein CYMTET_34757 [Cymbomonas tetramitiformis]|uniref:Uncharacterized protein n=1 Tax=Cymbomonas tetramitiformis TaxID=36881 RepID=A0AAE0FAD7_9CHLO|nr:hypothetical protein CYMTET_34757 [Cymbomonas tetramitiformis]
MSSLARRAASDAWQGSCPIAAETPFCVLDFAREGHVSIMGETTQKESIVSRNFLVAFSWSESVASFCASALRIPGRVRKSEATYRPVWDYSRQRLTSTKYRGSTWILDECSTGGHLGATPHCGELVLRGPKRLLVTEMSSSHASHAELAEAPATTSAHTADTRAEGTELVGYFNTVHPGDAQEDGDVVHETQCFGGARGEPSSGTWPRMRNMCINSQEKSQVNSESICFEQSVELNIEELRPCGPA